MNTKLALLVKEYLASCREVKEVIELYRSGEIAVTCAQSVIHQKQCKCNNLIDLFNNERKKVDFFNHNSEGNNYDKE